MKKKKKNNKEIINQLRSAINNMPDGEKKEELKEKYLSGNYTFPLKKAPSDPSLKDKSFKEEFGKLTKEQIVRSIPLKGKRIKEKKKVGKEKEAEKKAIPRKIDMDNGYFPYAQDIGRVLAKTTISGSHRAIIDCILSKTFGYPDKKSDKIDKVKRRIIEERITYREFANFTGIMRKNLSKYIKELIDWKMIKRRERGQYYIYRFNVLVSQWNKGIFRETVIRLEDTC